MHPTLITWHGLGFHTWGLMITLAFSAACLVLAVRSRRVGIDPDRLVPLYLLAPVLGLAGARLLHFTMAEPKLFFSHPLAYFDPGQGGFAFYGGVILGVIGGLIWARMAKIPLLKLCDLAAPAIMLGLALGRIGCFFAGCCHGRPVGLAETGTLIAFQGGRVVTVAGFPWVALVYIKNVGVGDIFDVPIFPTQAWESIGAFSLFLFLSWMWRYHRRFDGQIMGMMLVLYAGLRFTVETFRGDVIRGVDYLGLFSTSQMVSFAGFAIGLSLLIARWGKGVEKEVPVVVDEEG